MKQGPLTAAPAQKAAARREWRVRPSVRRDGTHDVVSPDGVIYGIYPCGTQARAICATRQAEEDRRARMVSRPCMCCRKPFDSEGPHNRLCQHCRRLGGEILDPQRPYIEPRGRS